MDENSELNQQMLQYDFKIPLKFYSVYKHMEFQTWWQLDQSDGL